MNVIETSNLTRRYRDQVALDGVTLNLEPNRIYGLLGRNGAGKTTLMSILTAQAFASSGELRVLPSGGCRFVRREFRRRPPESVGDRRQHSKSESEPDQAEGNGSRVELGQQESVHHGSDRG